MERACSTRPHEPRGRSAPPPPAAARPASGGAGRRQAARPPAGRDKNAVARARAPRERRRAGAIEVGLGAAPGEMQHAVELAPRQRRRDRRRKALGLDRAIDHARSPAPRRASRRRDRRRGPRRQDRAAALVARAPARSSATRSFWSPSAERTSPKPAARAASRGVAADGEAGQRGELLAVGMARRRRAPHWRWSSRPRHSGPAAARQSTASMRSSGATSTRGRARARQPRCARRRARAV